MRFMKGEGPFGDWFTHVLDWYKASRNSENILFIKYEEMQKDLSAVVSTIAKFIDVPLKPGLLHHVLEQSKFTSMAKNPRMNYQWKEWKDQVPKFMRKGVVGDWQNQFTAEQNMVFNALYQDKMGDFGLQFDFDLD